MFCLQVRALRQPGAELSRVTNTWPGTCVLSCFSGSGRMLALLCDGIGVRIIDYRALQSRWVLERRPRHCQVTVLPCPWHERTCMDCLQLLLKLNPEQAGLD